jgi:hypothetical protein
MSSRLLATGFPASCTSRLETRPAPAPIHRPERSLRVCHMGRGAHERESERELNVVLAEMFGPKGNYSDPEVEAANAVLDAREESND